jgi:hypothetical protein
MLFRALSAKKQQSSSILLIFQILILTGPLCMRFLCLALLIADPLPVINAHAYILFSRLLQAYCYLPLTTTPIGVHPFLSRLRPSALSTVFVVLDVVALVVQLIGGSSATPTATPEVRSRGIHIYMGGIGFQQGAIMGFAALCALFAKEMRHVDPGDAKGKTALPSQQRSRLHGWQPQLFALGFGLAMITIRIIYRFVEFSADGSEKPSAAIMALQNQEVWFYLLEATPMMLALVGFAAVHPGRGMGVVDERLPRGWLRGKLGCRGGGCCCGRSRWKGARGEPKGRERLGSEHDAGREEYGDRVLLVERRT